MDLTWYSTLAKPALTPPSWVFAPAWTLLYALMALAAFIVWRRSRGPARRAALLAFALQLALNLAWSPLFFTLHRPDLAFVDLVAMWIAIAATIVLFARVSRPAAWLLSPYLAWVTFAGYLNLGVWLLNAGI